MHRIASRILRIAARIIKIMIQAWQITPQENRKLQTDASTLDEVTRQLPEGYYSTFRTFDEGTRVLGLTSHLQRMYEPVPTPNVSESLLRQRLSELLEPYRPGEARVRVVMTRHGQVYVAIMPLSLLSRNVYEKGVRTETTGLARENPRLKTTSFIGRSDSERKHLAQEGIFEALLVRDGKILEGMTSNFFYVGQVGSLPYLGTARDNILFGITRETVIQLARGRGLDVRFQALRLRQLETISEAFITSSSRGIVPVIQIDQVTIGQGSPGTVTKELMSTYESYVLEIAEKI